MAEQRYEAGEKQEAIEILGNDEFALVMSDIRLPGINGIGLLKHVKELGYAGGISGLLEKLRGEAKPMFGRT